MKATFRLAALIQSNHIQSTVLVGIAVVSTLFASRTEAILYANRASANSVALINAVAVIDQTTTAHLCTGALVQASAATQSRMPLQDSQPQNLHALVVATAAHCVEKVDPKNLYVVASYSAYNFNADTDMFKVKGVQISKYRKSFVGSPASGATDSQAKIGDVAFLTLEMPRASAKTPMGLLPRNSAEAGLSPLPRTYKPLPLLEGAAAKLYLGLFARGQDVLTAGFGVATDPKETGFLHEGSLTLAGLTEGGHFVKLTRKKLGAAPCRGDSGGPLYVRIFGQWYIAGILSHGYLTAEQRAKVRGNLRTQCELSSPKFSTFIFEP